MTSVPKVILIEADEELRYLMGELLTSARIPMVIIEPEAFRKSLSLQWSASDVFVLSERLPELSIVDSLHRLKNVLGVEMLSNQVFVSSRDPEHVSLELSQYHGEFQILEIPFDPSQFLDQLRSALKRSEARVQHHGPMTETGVGRLEYGSIVMDQKNFDAYCNHRRVDLTPSEFSLLQALVSAPGKIYSRDELLNWVQDKGIVVVDRVVDTHVFALRKKLGECGQMIQTIRGTGYCLRSPE